MLFILIHQLQRKVSMNVSEDTFQVLLGRAIQHLKGYLQFLTDSQGDEKSTRQLIDEGTDIL